MKKKNQQPPKLIVYLSLLLFAAASCVNAKNATYFPQDDGIKITHRLNLNSINFLPVFYYHKSNDVVYVEANKSKIVSIERASQIAPIVASELSSHVTLVDRLG